MHESAKQESNKIIITDMHQKRFLFLLNQNRLLYACPFDLQKKNLLNHIYIGKVQKLVTNIDAAFVEFQKGMVGFLPMNDCREQYPLLKAGDEILVQVCKDAIKTKLPVLTTKISLTGTYCVLTFASQTPKLHFSGKLSNTVKIQIEQALKESGICQNPTFDIIIRTNAGTLSDFEPLLKEIQSLSEELKKFINKSKTRTCFSCIKGEDMPFWIQEIRSIPVTDYDEIITDSPEIHEQLSAFSHDRIRLYQDETYSLRLLYGLDSKLECALNRRIWLKSGAYLIIEPTEALTVIDVNTGKYEAKKDIAEAFLAINKEAAEEIALQLRLRNLSGIILVDFINMESKEYQKDLLCFMRSLTEKDSVRTNVIDITPLGLMEITRKKLRRPLKEELGEQ